ncbi:hypothetical protein PSYCIT7_010200 [Pseudomonas syringae Cit 7]|uniref:Uncharacterized protein n=1 Tax=Pseudomonas syringae Cit 7 TaxID=629264 RepID=A0A8T8M2P5_PSESX|nr:hypothetical protein [Pseudomonas syringae]PBP60215.1 hypothetical protein CCL19_22735 [Pseudomonas syringae]QUP67969.1 hypothetical protein PSYCIT7_010200 [Pseudomonas syringae Cit 7]SDS29045.1 hypothetical protein SAMN05421724_1094 [Pseudomonas syringae]
MEISDELLERFPDAPLATAFEVCQMVTSRVSSNTLARHEGLMLEVVLCLFTAEDAGLLTYDLTRPIIQDGKISTGEAYNYIAGVQRHVEGIIAKEAALDLQRSLEARFAKAMNADYGYELTDGDVKEAQQLIDELRKFIQSTPDISDDHRRRLLERLEAVQSELHKKMSSLDRIYCLTIEASIVAGKVGENAKPFLSAAKALFQLAWRTHAHKEGLPSGALPPLLGNDIEPPALD